MLTFEFPDSGKANAFARVLLGHCAVKISHRVVDVVAPADSDIAITAICHDYVIALARKHGAVDGPRPFDLTPAEREALRDLLAEIVAATAATGAPYPLPLDGTDLSALLKVLTRVLARGMAS